MVCVGGTVRLMEQLDGWNSTVGSVKNWPIPHLSLVIRRPNSISILKSSSIIFIIILADWNT